MAYDIRDVEREDGTTEREYLVFDPWEGTSTWVPRSDVENHTMQAVPTQPHLFRVLEPGNTGRDANPELQAYLDRNAPPPAIEEAPPVRRELEPVRELPRLEPLEVIEPITLEPLPNQYRSEC